VVGGSHVGVEEEFAGISVGPVFGDVKLGFSGIDCGDEVLQGAVLADEF
jgi:hypothetical protein